MLDPPGARRLYHGVGDRPERETLVVPDVEDLTRRVDRECRTFEKVDDVVDVETVALLRTVAEHGDGVVLEGAPHEDREEPLEVVEQPLTRAEHVRQADGRRP